MTARPGQWPVDEPVDLDALEADDDQGARHLALTKARAALVMPMESIRADLETQPSLACIRAAERRWKNEISAAANQAAKQLRNTG